jgi:hypothetical protein
MVRFVQDGSLETVNDAVELFYISSQLDILRDMVKLMNIQSLLILFGQFEFSYCFLIEFGTVAGIRNSLDNWLEKDLSLAGLRSGFWDVE